MEFCSTYIETDKFDEVVEFYEKLTQKKELFTRKTAGLSSSLGTSFLYIIASLTNLSLILVTLEVDLIGTTQIAYN